MFGMFKKQISLIELGRGIIKVAPIALSICAAAPASAQRLPKLECYSACNFDPLSQGIGVQN